MYRSPVDCCSAVDISGNPNWGGHLWCLVVPKKSNRSIDISPWVAIFGHFLCHKLHFCWEKHGKTTVTANIWAWSEQRRALSAPAFFFTMWDSGWISCLCLTHSVFLFVLSLTFLKTNHNSSNCLWSRCVLWPNRLLFFKKNKFFPQNWLERTSGL